jgi:hypothetical protein
LEYCLEPLLPRSPWDQHKILFEEPQARRHLNVPMGMACIHWESEIGRQWFRSRSTILCNHYQYVDRYPRKIE